MSKFNFQAADGQWYTGGVSATGSVWAQSQKGKRTFVDEEFLIENEQVIANKLNSLGSKTKTSESEVAKRLGALALKALGDSAEG